MTPFDLGWEGSYFGTRTEAGDFRASLLGKGQVLHTVTQEKGYLRPSYGLTGRLSGGLRYARCRSEQMDSSALLLGVTDTQATGKSLVAQGKQLRDLQVRTGQISACKAGFLAT